MAQPFYSSSTHLWLAGTQHLCDAEARADEAVDMFQSAPPEKQRLGEMSLARMDLAMARLGRGDIDGAGTQIHTVLEVSARRRTESRRPSDRPFQPSARAAPRGRTTCRGRLS